MSLPTLLCHRTAFHQGQCVTLLQYYFRLVHDLALPGDEGAFASGANFFLHDCCPNVQRIADEDGFQELPIADAYEGERSHGWAIEGEAAADGHHQDAMGDGLAKRTVPGKLVIHVDGVEVAGDAGEVDEVGLGDGAGGRCPALTDVHIIHK